MVATSPSGRCSIKAKMFNEKEARTGLRDVVLAFDGDPPLEQTLKDRSTWRQESHSIRMDELETVPLPSREWIVLNLETVIDAKEARSLATCERAWLRGYYPDGRLFSERVPPRRPSSPGPSSCPYSPNLVEQVFSEVQHSTGLAKLGPEPPARPLDGG